MREDWSKRARENAFYYIASWRKDWDEDAFWQAGREDYERLVASVLVRHGISPERKSMLELGCGMGRMTRSFAQNFERVIGLDISSEMLDRARLLNPSAHNVEWLLGNGVDLGCVPSSSVDFVFSYLVLQHLPKESMVHSYVRDILRVLASRGIALFQFNGTREKGMNWKGRAAWALVDSIWVARLRTLSRSTARILGLDPNMAGKSWHGVHVRTEDIAQTVQRSGGTVIELKGVNTPMAWCYAQKK